jgi:hypothetical protein
LSSLPLPDTSSAKVQGKEDNPTDDNKTHSLLTSPSKGTKNNTSTKDLTKSPHTTHTLPEHN